jgi:hypothetical protein
MCVRHGFESAKGMAHNSFYYNTSEQQASKLSVNFKIPSIHNAYHSKNNVFVPTPMYETNKTKKIIVSGAGHQIFFFLN